jgi:hypothetical protein
MGMGFSLKKASVVVVTGMAFQLMGCKLPEMKKEETLAKSTAQKVSDVLWTELGKVDLHQIKPGQYVHYESNYRAEQSAVVKVVDVARSVNSVESTAESTNVVMQELFRTYTQNGAIEDEKISDVVWTLEKTLSSLNAFVSSAFRTSAYGPFATEDYDYVDYFNLTSSRKVIAAPPAIQARPDCGGFANCTIDALEVNYLAHLVKGTQVIKRIQYKVVLSAQVPAIFWDEQNPIWPVVSECMAHTIETYYVNECVVLRDAQK